jgi:hypothetical protein
MQLGFMSAIGRDLTLEGVFALGRVDTGRADRVPVGHDTSDRDSVTEVVVRIDAPL